jgi:hypothetical protein
MSGSHVENGHLFDLQDQIGEQQLVEVVDELIEVAVSSWCRGLWLLGAN